MKWLTARKTGGAVGLLAALAAGLATAVALTSGAPAATARATTETNGALHIRVDLQRFQAQPKRHRLVAQGQVIATYRSGGTVKGQTTKAVVMAAQQGTTCRVLHLELGELHLELLGLLVNLTPVDDPNIVIDISADSGEALGHLLCQVINSVQSGTAPKTLKATKRLNAAVHKTYRGGIANLDVPLAVRSGAAATTTTSPTTTPTTTTTASTARFGQCEVLNLVLGPLNLDLLGLIVTLNKIQLDLSANPVGTLGTLFCQLAGTTTASSTATTTGGTTTSTP